MRHLLVFIALLAACGGSNGTAGEVPLEELKVGACGAPTADSTFIHSFTVGSCVTPHAMELAGRYTLTDATYPGGSRLRYDTQVACIPIFAQYVGLPYLQSDFELRTISPSPSTWAAGDRTVLCFVVAADGGMLDASARGAMR